MQHTKTLMVLAGAALSVSGLNTALADQATVNRDEVRAIVSEMLNDAQTRSSLLQGQGNAGYDKKFFLASPDNNYRLNVGGYLQFRYQQNWRQNDDGFQNDFQSGFMWRRARLEFSGHVITPDLKFLISGDFADGQERANNANGGATALNTQQLLGLSGLDLNAGPTAAQTATFLEGRFGLAAGALTNTFANGRKGVTWQNFDADGNVIGGAFNAQNSTILFVDFNNNGAQDAGEVNFTGFVPQFGGYATDQSGFHLKDAVVDYSLGGGWYVRAGSYKLPFLKEELIADTMQLSAERSLVNSVFTGGRSDGVGFGYRDETFRWMADYSDGFNANGTALSRGDGNILNGVADWSFTTRGEYAFAGKLDDWKEFTSKQDDEFKGYVGAAFHIQGAQNDEDKVGVANGRGAGFDLSAVDPQRYVSYTADVGIKGSGFNLFAAFVGSNTRFLQGEFFGQNKYSDYNDFGVMVQGGWRFIKDDEIFARWDGLFYDKDRFTANNQPNYNFITFGWNHYFAGQACKFTLDTVIALDPTVEAATSALNGFANEGVTGVSRRFSSPFGDNQGIYNSTDNAQVAVRAQFQLMF